MTTYTKAIAWIAQHETHTEHNPLMTADEPLSPDVVATYITVAMVSDLFGVDEGCIVQDVCAEHKRQGQQAHTLRSVADVRRERAR